MEVLEIHSSRVTLLDPEYVRTCILLLITNEFSTKGLRFMVQALVKILPHCQTLHTPLGLIISKMLRGKSSLSSLSPLCCVNIVALLYKKVGHEQSVSFSLKSAKMCFKIQLASYDNISCPLVFLVGGYNLYK